MWFLKKTIATHNGGYHADDVFACATLSILMKGSVRIIRTRDIKVIEKSDYVVDVGGVYDGQLNRFDHHQLGGAGKRENGIPYASFGLVWKEYGESVCGSHEIADMIESRIVVPIDAIDNGVSIIKDALFMPYTINDVLVSIDAPDGATEKEEYKAFQNAVTLAEEILKGEIEKTKTFINHRDLIFSTYVATENKRIIILDKYVSRYDINSTLSNSLECVYVVVPRNGNSQNGWRVEAIRGQEDDFLPRKKFPPNWCGLSDKELQNVTGVEDAIFCHNAGFLFVTQTKEGAIQIANKALNQ